MDIKIDRNAGKRYLTKAEMDAILAGEVVDKETLRLLSQLLEQSRYDALTKIYNREYFNEAVKALLAAHKDLEYVMCIWNVQSFKVVNDVFGNDTGDRVLKNIAEKLQRVFKDTPSVYGRLTGDNFAFCMPKSLLPMEDFVKYGTITLISDTDIFTFKSHFGLYEIDDINLSVEEMCTRAKMALKTITSRDEIPVGRYGKQLSQALIEDQEFITTMDMAMEEGQFEVYYQPIYNLFTGTVSCAEALVRWNHPKKGLIPPDRFIPLFEKNGLISRLDRYVWTEVCRVLKDQVAAGEPVVPVSINVSRVDFYNHDLWKDIIDIVESAGIDKSLFHIEITESAYTDDANQLLEAVNRLRSYGFVLLMDDFGSGYSSLNSLKDMPVDVLKIDLKFMRGFERSQKAGCIVGAIVRMAKWLGMEVIAEGVETKEQVDFLNSIGCEKGQGYYYSRPQPLRTFKRILARSPKHSVDEIFCESVEDLNLAAVWSTSKEGNAVFNSIIGAVGFYEMIGNKLEAVRVNDSYYKLFKGNDEQVFKGEASMLDRLNISDRIDVVELCDEARQTKEVQSIKIDFCRYDGVVIKVILKIRYLGGIGRNYAYYIHYEEVEG